MRSMYFNNRSGLLHHETKRINVHGPEVAYAVNVNDCPISRPKEQCTKFWTLWLLTSSYLVLDVLFTGSAKYSIQQECIPVGCVPPARLPYAGVCFSGGGCTCLVPGGCTCQVWGGGTCLVPGGCVPGLVLGGVYLPGPGGVPGPGGGCTCLVLGGVPAWSGGVYLPGPGGVPGQVLPPHGQNDTRLWKYYLAPNFVCGR